MTINAAEVCIFVELVALFHDLNERDPDDREIRAMLPIVRLMMADARAKRLALDLSRRSDAEADAGPAPAEPLPCTMH
jgi:hypothetical protein